MMKNDTSFFDYFVLGDKEYDHSAGIFLRYEAGVSENRSDLTVRLGA